MGTGENLGLDLSIDGFKFCRLAVQNLGQHFKGNSNQFGGLQFFFGQSAVEINQLF